MSKLNGKYARAAWLTARPRLYDPRDRMVIEEVAGPLREREAHGERLNAEEQRIVTRADALRVFEPERAPDLPELDPERGVVAEAALKVAAAETVADEALDDVRLARAACWEEALASKAGTASPKALAKLKAAEGKHQEAAAIVGRLRVALTEAAIALDARRRELLAERAQQ